MDLCGDSLMFTKPLLIIQKALEDLEGGHRSDMDLETLREYIRLHIISLEQDLESNPESINVVDIAGQIEGCKHILGVIND